MENITDKSRIAITNKYNAMSRTDKQTAHHYVSIYASITEHLLVAFDCKNPVTLHESLMPKHSGALFFAAFLPKSNRAEAENFAREFNRQQKDLRAIWQDCIEISPEIKELPKYIDPSFMQPLTGRVTAP